MSGVDFDQIAETLRPEQLAAAIGALSSRSPGTFHCPGRSHENGDQKGPLTPEEELGI